MSPARVLIGGCLAASGRVSNAVPETNGRARGLKFLSRVMMAPTTVPHMVSDGNDLTRYWEMSEVELLDALGTALLDEGIGFAPEDPARRGRFAAQWLEDRWERIRAVLCGDPRIRAALRSEFGDRMLEAATIADALATLAGRPATSVLAVIVLRRGGAALCAAAD